MDGWEGEKGGVLWGLKWALSARRPTASIVGSRTMETKLAGPPASWMVRLKISIAFAETRLAAGCTLKTAALPGAVMMMMLLSITGIGWVDGVIAATTP